MLWQSEIFNQLFDAFWAHDQHRLIFQRWRHSESAFSDPKSKTIAPHKGIYLLSCFIDDDMSVFTG